MRITIGPEQAGERLDAVVAGLTGASSRSAAQRLIDAGAVTVDGRVRPKSHRVAAEEALEISPPAPPPPAAAEPATFAIAHEDEHLVVVDKPAGVVVHPGAGRETGTLAQALADRIAGGPDPARAGIVHRLDRDTSGLLVAARSERAHAALTEMIRRREVSREYLALVEGRPDARAGTIDAALGRDRRRRTLVSTDTDRPRAAVTHFEVIEVLPDTALLTVRLETGRTHQIRAHMTAIGHPVVGDSRYGGAPAGRRLGLDRQFLHSTRLAFSHPITREALSCESKPPADLLRALEAARRDPVSGGPAGD